MIIKNSGCLIKILHFKSVYYFNSKKNIPNISIKFFQNFKIFSNKNNLVFRKKHIVLFKSPHVYKKAKDNFLFIKNFKKNLVVFDFNLFLIMVNLFFNCCSFAKWYYKVKVIYF